MAQYEATLSDRILVYCECENCGQEFHYEAYIKGWGRAYSKKGAEEAALKDLNKKLKSLKTFSSRDHRCLRHIQPEKCPHCKHTQSWMQLYYRSHLTTWLLAVVAIVSFFIIVLVDAINSSGTNILIAVLVAGAVFAMGVGVIEVKFSSPDDSKVKLPQLSLPQRIQYL